MVDFARTLRVISAPVANIALAAFAALIAMTALPATAQTQAAPAATAVLAVSYYRAPVADCATDSDDITMLDATNGTCFVEIAPEAAAAFGKKIDGIFVFAVPTTMLAGAGTYIARADDEANAGTGPCAALGIATPSLPRVGMLKIGTTSATSSPDEHPGEACLAIFKPDAARPGDGSWVLRFPWAIVYADDGVTLRGARGMSEARGEIK